MLRFVLSVLSLSLGHRAIVIIAAHAKYPDSDTPFEFLFPFSLCLFLSLCTNRGGAAGRREGEKVRKGRVRDAAADRSLMGNVAGR